MIHPPPFNPFHRSFLVGGLNPSEKYQSLGVIILNIWKNDTCFKAPTSFPFRSQRLVPIAQLQRLRQQLRPAPIPGGAPAEGHGAAADGHAPS